LGQTAVTAVPSGIQCGVLRSSFPSVIEMVQEVRQQYDVISGAIVSVKGAARKGWRFATPALCVFLGTFDTAGNPAQ
jgi:hypothetical protein